MIRSLISRSLQRSRSSPSAVLTKANRRTVHAALATQSFSTETFTSDWRLLAAAAAAAYGSWMTSTTRCDAEEEVDDIEEEDPYDNLPEDDEPTHCSICLTYRQGPCRTYWRKVERCTKDNELKPEKKRESSPKTDNEEDNEEPIRDPPCLKYMTPWIDCAIGYRNLYSLIELDTNYTAGIAELENEAADNFCWAPGKEPKIDWRPWQTYAAQSKWKLPKQEESSVSATSAADKVSLWKTLDQTKDPQLVELKCVVPMTQGEGVLECAYAVDQDGNVLGFAYGKKPSQAQDKTDDDKPAVTMSIRLLPSRTRKVYLSAAYTQPPNEGAGDLDPLTSHIYRGRPLSLKAMAKAAS